MVFSIQLAIFLFIEILRFNCEIYNLLSENIKRPFMGRCFCPGRYLDAVFWHLCTAARDRQCERACYEGSFYIFFKNHEFRSYNKKY